MRKKKIFKILLKLTILKVNAQVISSMMMINVMMKTWTAKRTYQTIMKFRNKFRDILLQLTIIILEALRVVSMDFIEITTTMKMTMTIIL